MVPRFLLGHSMGGQIVTKYALISAKVQNLAGVIMICKPIIPVALFCLIRTLSARLRLWGWYSQMEGDLGKIFRFLVPQTLHPSWP